MSKKKQGAEPQVWMPQQIEMLPLASLAAYSRNARVHSEAQVAQLAKSIKTFGWTIPVLIQRDGTIVAGHGRVQAAHLLGLPEVPVVRVPEHWTPAQIRAYTLADNKLALNASWDASTLAKELSDLGSLVDLGELQFDVGDMGFNDDELARVFDDAAQNHLAAVEATTPVEDEQEPTNRPTGAAGGDELTSFSCPLSHADLAVVHTAIRAVKRHRNAATTGEALVILAKEWAQ
jgi:hypothetical protein